MLSKFLCKARHHRTVQFILPILLVPCWLEAPWPPTVLGMLQDIPYWFSIIEDLTMDVSVYWVLKGLHSLHLKLWLLRAVCSADKDSLPLSDSQWWGQLKCLQQRFTSNAGMNGLINVLKRVC